MDEYLEIFINDEKALLEGSIKELIYQEVQKKIPPFFEIDFGANEIITTCRNPRQLGYDLAIKITRIIDKDQYLLFR